MKQSDVEAWQKKLAVFDQRLLAWQQTVKQELEREFARLRAENRLQEPAAQEEAVRRAMARAGDGPRCELNGAIDELCLAYLRGSNDDRAVTRAMLRETPAIFHDLWGYIRRAAEELRAGGGEQWLRMGLAIASIEDQLTDYQDTIEGLIELYQAAAKRGIDPRHAFAEIGELSSQIVNERATASTRDLLQNFDPNKIAAELSVAHNQATNQR
jgi:hypothetical protein